VDARARLFQFQIAQVHLANKGGTSVVNLDDEIRKRREQKRQRTADGSPQSPPIDAKLDELLQHINASEELRREGFAAEIEDGRVVLKRRGKSYGEWLIHDAWFEYRGQAASKDHVYRAAWLEDAIALTSSIVTGMHGKARHRNGRIERSRTTFTVKEEKGEAVALNVQLVDGDMPSLGNGQLAFSFPDGTDIEGARRIARQMNRDISAITFKRRRG
jgi:hypothetical protein